MRRNVRSLAVCAFMTALVVCPALAAEETEQSGSDVAVPEAVGAAPDLCARGPSQSAAGFFESIQAQLRVAAGSVHPDGTCTISVECNCCDETVSCSGASAGDCHSGGSGCYEWVQCGSQARKYCRSQEQCGPPCPAPCTKNSQCTAYCGGYGFCLNGCCAC